MLRACPSLPPRCREYFHQQKVFVVRSNSCRLRTPLPPHQLGGSIRAQDSSRNNSFFHPNFRYSWMIEFHEVAGQLYQLLLDKPFPFFFGDNALFSPVVLQFRSFQKGIPLTNSFSMGLSHGTRFSPPVPEGSRTIFLRADDLRNSTRFPLIESSCAPCAFTGCPLSSEPLPRNQNRRPSKCCCAQFLSCFPPERAALEGNFFRSQQNAGKGCFSTGFLHLAGFYQKVAFQLPSPSCL